MRRIAVVASGLTIAFAGTASAEAAQPSKGGGDSLKSGNRLAVALTDQNQLVSFKVRNPDRLLSIRSIRGLQPGVSMVGIDYRPKTGDLYGVGSNSAVYRINPQTGIAIAENVDAMGNPVPFTPGLNGTNFGIDFNPAPDAIRIVSDAGQNKRVAPDAGTTLGDDLALNPGMPKVGGAAYTNSSFNFTQPLAANVQLFVVDYANDMVFLQNPPNNGTLTNGRRLTGVDVQPSSVGTSPARTTSATWPRATAAVAPRASTRSTRPRASRATSARSAAVACAASSSPASRCSRTSRSSSNVGVPVPGQ